MPRTTTLAPEMTINVVNQDAHRRRWSLPIPCLLFLGSLAVYWLTRTHLNTFDAVAYANQIGLATETGKLRPLFHPHHLLFNALGFGLWRMACFLGYGGGPLIVTQSLNAVLGAGGVVLYYGVLRRLRPAGQMPLTLALGLGGSFGYWICATDGRVNMPSMVLMLAAFHTLLRLRDHPTMRQAAIIGLLAGMAVLFHESTGLFGIVGGVGIFLSASGRRRRRRLLTAYGTAWAAVIAAAYVSIGLFALHLHSPMEFRHWMNAYAERGWWWDFHILHNLRLDLFGLRHAVFVVPLGRAALAQTPWQPLGTAMLGLLWLLYALALLGLAALGSAIAANLPRLWKSDDRPIVVVSLVWILLYGAFFTIWCPGAFVFWVPVLVPLGTLLVLCDTDRYPLRVCRESPKSGPSAPSLGNSNKEQPAPALIPTPQDWGGGAVWALFLHPLRKAAAVPLGIWVGTFTTLNFLGGVLPGLKPIAGRSQRVAADIRVHTPSRALILVSGVGADAQCEVDVPYFADRPVLSVHGLLSHSPSLPAAQVSLQTSLTKAFGAHRQVYVLDEIWSHRDSVMGLQRQSPKLTAESLRSLFVSYPRTLAWIGPRGPVWQLFPESSFPSRSFVPLRRTKGEVKGKVDDTKSGASTSREKNGGQD